MLVTPPTSVPLACLTRSGVPDTLHRGSVAVIDASGKEQFVLGDPETRAYIRSAAKPIQCIPVLTSGAAEAFGLDDRDIAIICGSHRGGPEQVAQVRSILAKCGLSEALLRSGSGIADNCSGKHAGMLAACTHQGLPLDNYTDPGHPHQRAIVEVLKSVCCLGDDEWHIGVDGCSAPIHYFTIEKMALGYARLSVAARHFDEPTASAVGRIIPAMWANPGGHTGEPAYADVLGAEPRLLSKAGGNGVYCAGVIGRGLGFAMKVDDGNRAALRPVFVEVLRRLGVFTDVEAGELMDLVGRSVMNRRGEVVGAVELLF